jgi:multidrug efflux pump subunit AcrA (membrane-fusion protein)
VDEMSVHKVRPGQGTTIRLDAYPDLTLTGRVSRVGTVARSSVDRPFEEKRFDLVIDVDPTKADLRPEMTARVDVLVGRRSDALLIPVNAVFDQEGQPVVHVVRTFSVKTRAVELGEANELFVEVTAGLKAGERVALIDMPGQTGAAAAESQAAQTGVKAATPDVGGRGAPLGPK